MENFKRYALVEYDSYYPGGFESDCLERFNTIDEAKLHVVNNKISADYLYIFDLVEWERVFDFT